MILGMDQTTGLIDPSVPNMRTTKMELTHDNQVIVGLSVNKMHYFTIFSPTEDGGSLFVVRWVYGNTTYQDLFRDKNY